MLSKPRIFQLTLLAKKKDLRQHQVQAVIAVEEDGNYFTEIQNIELASEVE